MRLSMTVVYYIKLNNKDRFIVGESYLQKFCEIYAEKTDDAIEYIKQHSVKFIEMPIYSDFDYCEIE